MNAGMLQKGKKSTFV